MKFTINRTDIILKKADITEEDTEAIVNAANRNLQHGSGVAGAIVRKGGPIIQEESQRIGTVETGNAAITSGGNLKAQFVIHAVGPRMGEGEEDEKLRLATWNSLRLADEGLIQTLAFPAISTGIFGYPIDRCASIMLEAVRKYCKGETAIREIRFCLLDEAALHTFEETAKTVLKT
jgi:O-acetyl-ADP-ribose deacetylase (regulator of RNase III)